MRAELRSAVAVAVPAVLLGVLAVLQYRWIDEVSRAERERAKAHLSEAARRFSADLAGRLSSIREAFRVPQGATLAEVEDRLAVRWPVYVEEAREPDLVRGVDVIIPAKDGAEERILRFEPSRGEFVPVRSDELDRSLLGELAEGPPLHFGNDLSVLVVPVGGRMSRNGVRAPIVVIRLDSQLIFEHLLPDLAERWFGGPDGLEAAVALLEVSPVQRRVAWTSDPTLDWSGTVELEVPLLASQPGMGGRRWPRGGPRAGDRPPRRFDRQGGGTGREPMLGSEPGVVVAVSHRAGSLDAAVDMARARNLAVASAVLVLLAGSFAMSLLTARRARHMARQQVDFVAGVTHELKTPLAAIRSAGENLADGIVSEDPQVREYGVLVDRESRRLDEMVTELLELAGLQGRRRDPVLAPVAVSEIVDGALDDCRWTLDESGVEVEVDLARDLPAVLGERSSLRRAVHNLIHNAAIYGRAGGWVGVTAIAQPRSGRQGVAITVRDRGPGIARAEQSRVFEPFVRGREAGAVRASGSGLGLAVVHHVAEQHTGRVELDSDRSGTAVTLWLPAMPPEGAAGAGGDEP